MSHESCWNGCLDLLNEQYNNTKITISLHISNLLNLETLKLISDLEGLCALEEFKIIILREFDKNVWDIPKVLKIFKCELTAREKSMLQCDLGPQNDIPYSASNLFTSRQKFQKGTQGTDDKSKFKDMCMFCRTNHSSTRYDIMTDPKVRNKLS